MKGTKVKKSACANYLSNKFIIEKSRAVVTATLCLFLNRPLASPYLHFKGPYLELASNSRPEIETRCIEIAEKSMRVSL